MPGEATTVPGPMTLRFSETRGFAREPAGANAGTMSAVRSVARRWPATAPTIGQVREKSLAPEVTSQILLADAWGERRAFDPVRRWRQKLGCPCGEARRGDRRRRRDRRLLCTRACAPRCAGHPPRARAGARFRMLGRERRARLPEPLDADLQPGIAPERPALDV